jgi:hypothetical protein
VALVTTILTVVAILGGISFLLWLSTFIEVRQLGPLGSAGLPAGPAVAEPGAQAVVEAVQTAA